MRVVQRAVAVIVFSTALLGAPGAAYAHAVVVSSSPNDGARLTSPPAEVKIRFSEPVSVDLGGLRVVDNKGQRIDTGESLNAGDPMSISARLRGDLGEGTFVASYRVVSGDGHPIAGAITFVVGDASSRVDTSALPGSGDPLSEDLGWASRWLTYTAALLAAGAAFFVWFVFDGGPERHMLSKLVIVSGAAALVGLAGQLTAQASLATGRGLGAISDGSVWGAVLGNNLGWASGVLVVGLAGAFAAMGVRRAPVARALSLGSLVAVAVSFALWGHSVEGSLAGLKIVFDSIHAFAGAVWFGGLVCLAVVLSSRRPGSTSGADPSDPGDDEEAETGSPASTARVVARFSVAAAFTALGLTISGLVLAWQELGSVSALWSSGYGRLLLVKVGFVAAILAVAAYNRYRLVPATVGATVGGEGTGDRSASMGKLLSAVRIEVVGVLVVLALTAVLVNTVPGRAAQVPVGPFDQTVAFGANQVKVGVTPAQAGPNQIHVTFLDPGGQPVAAARRVEVEFTQPQAAVGPITRQAIPAGTGHFVLDTNDLSIPGTWQIVFTARLSDFDQQRLTFQVPVGG